jgi:hypothetical protein
MIHLTRKHEWKSTTEGEYCLHCNSRTGIGFYSIISCTPRFNEEAFQNYLNFKNLSKINDNEFVRRFSNKTFLKKEVVKNFKSLCDKKELKEFLKQKNYVTENLT